MDSLKQYQKGGEDSQQYQIGTVVVNGISEERVRAIFSEMFSVAIRDYTQEAEHLARERVGRLEESLMLGLQNKGNLLPAFSDPALHVLLRKAQIASMATERESDYDLLSQLIVCRLEKGNDRKNRAGIDHAVEIVDKIDNDALCALTVAYAIQVFSPVSGNVDEGLSALDRMCSKLLYMDLPKGDEWLDHLDTLGCIRMNPLGGLKKLHEMYEKKLEGYVCAGLQSGTQSLEDARRILADASLNADSFLVKNGLAEGYYRLPVVKKGGIDSVAVIHKSEVARTVNKKESDALVKVWDLYDGKKEVLDAVKKKFVTKLNSYPSLNAIADWWDSIPTSFGISRAGVVLAHTNAKRCDKRLPDLI